MNKILTFPKMPFNEWIELWEKGYAEEYGAEDDTKYSNCMAALRSAADDESVRTALLQAFDWKDGIRYRYETKLRGLTRQILNALKETQEVPTFWPNGAVFNVFLLHLVTDGRRPLIDQHAWRGYCYLTAREKRPEFPQDHACGVKRYLEYEQWFNSQLNVGIEPRSLDKALMVFGQFCSQFRPVIESQLKMNR